ncbi:MAG: thiamine-phosphate kinase [Burkholderiaceae bacterium]
MTEFDLINQFFKRSPPRRAELGIGDDGALLPAGKQTRVVACDTMVCGRHFFEGAEPRALGYKALAVNLSDLAAMGAKPDAFLLALTLPHADADWLAAFSDGLFELADKYDCELVGGDTTRGPLTITITALGGVDPGSALRRDTAEPGDDLWVSGELGSPAVAVRARQTGHWPEGLRPELTAARLDRPEPRVSLGISLRHFARAAVDISDGLIADIGHIGARSRVRLQVNTDAVPVAACLGPMAPAEALNAALTGGDDYELAFTAAPENRPAIERIGATLDLPLSCIGQVMSGEGVSVVDGGGRPVTFGAAGHDHFGASIKAS